MNRIIHQACPVNSCQFQWYHRKQRSHFLRGPCLLGPQTQTQFNGAPHLMWNLPYSDHVCHCSSEAEQYNVHLPETRVSNTAWCRRELRMKIIEPSQPQPIRQSRDQRLPWRSPTANRFEGATHKMSDAMPNTCPHMSPCRTVPQVGQPCGYLRQIELQEEASASGVSKL